MSDNLLEIGREQFLVKRSCYTDDAVFHDEVARILERTWLFIGHESELNSPGDFVTTDLAGQPVIALKGDDGKIRVFLNTCRHRGAMVETERRGCRKRFQCLYHHWAYDTCGRLTFVPREEGFGRTFDKSKLGLVPVARVTAFHGLVFANLDADAMPFEDYIGTAQPYLTELANYSGRPQKALASFEYSYEGNWKLLYENTLDDYHAEHLHSHVYMNVPGFNYGGDYMRQNLGAKAGHKAIAEPPSRSCSQLGMHSVLEWHDLPEKMPLQKERTHRINLAIFPTFLGVYHPVLDITGLRIIKPHSPTKTTVLTYCLAPADLDEPASRAVAERFSAAWGPGGRIMIDDLRCLALVQQGLKAKGGGDVIISRGMERAGPKGTVADEHSIRAFWGSWNMFMQRGKAAAYERSR